MRDTKSLGIVGEKAATVFLQAAGYRIVEKNYCCRYGEIDIIAEYGYILAFVEVKTRRNMACGYPAEAVTRSKQQKIIAVAKHYQQQQDVWDKQCRFDVIEVLWSGEKASCHHICNAFGC